MLGFETKQELEKLIEDYGKKKERLDLLKKQVDSTNTRIKALLTKNDLDSFESDNYKVNYQVRKSESLDEQGVIEILKENKIRGIVKSKEYVDEDALENAIYNGKIEANVLKEINDCKVVKESYALTIKEKK